MVGANHKGSRDQNGPPKPKTDPPPPPPQTIIPHPQYRPTSALEYSGHCFPPSSAAASHRLASPNPTAPAAAIRAAIIIAAARVPEEEEARCFIRCGVCWDQIEKGTPTAAAAGSANVPNLPSPPPHTHPNPSVAIDRTHRPSIPPRSDRRRQRRQHPPLLLLPLQLQGQAAARHRTPSHAGSRSRGSSSS